MGVAQMGWDLQTRPKSWPTWWTFCANRYLEIMFSKFSGVNPPHLLLQQYLSKTVRRALAIHIRLITSLNVNGVTKYVIKYVLLQTARVSVLL